MPSFAQYLLESNLILLSMLVVYHWKLSRKMAFGIKRQLLRFMVLAAFSLPLLTTLTINTEIFIIGQPVKMAFESSFPIDCPPFTLTLKTALFALFFFGFAIRAFQLVDRLWAVGAFLKINGNRPVSGWQGSPTACFSQLLFSWEHWDENQKNTWARKWLPLHPLFGWEYFTLELLYALNWWNPLMHWYRGHWMVLYRYDFGQPCHQPTLSNRVGSIFTMAFLAFLFVAIPQKFSLTPTAGQWVGNRVDQIIFEHKKPPLPDYRIEWGKISIQLKKYANPNGFEGTVNIELADIHKILKEELKIYRGQERLKPGTLSVLFRSGSTEEKAYINDIDPKSVLLKDRRNGKIYNDKLGYGDELTLFGETEDIYLSNIQIRIIDPKAGYEPVVKVPEIDHHEADFSFQIVGRIGKRALFKIDTEHPNAQRILELYRDTSRYEIVQIPGFRTNRRYMTEKEALLSKFSTHGFDLASGLPDVNYLPEYQGYQNLHVSLHWGALEAAPSSENYTLAVFNASAVEEPELWIGNKKLKLEAFEIIIAGKGFSFGYHTDRLGYSSLQETLGSLQPESSVYFDRIVVRDEDGVTKLFPAAFAFHVGRFE